MNTVKDKCGSENAKGDKNHDHDHDQVTIMMTTLDAAEMNFKKNMQMPRLEAFFSGFLQTGTLITAENQAVFFQNGMHLIIIQASC